LRLAAGASLDALGRQLLEFADPRFCSLAALALVVIFVAVRRWRYGVWPPVTGCIRVAVSFLALLSAIVVAVVFLMTMPPAIESLSPETLTGIGLLVLIAVVGQVGGDLVVLFWPPEVRDTVRPPFKKK